MEFYTNVTHSPFNLDNFSNFNDDPRILTLIVVGTEDHVRAHILRQHTLGLTQGKRISDCSC
jgi:hypothetical protein